MANNITVRDVDPADKSWLQRKSRQYGVSVEEMVRRLIQKERARKDIQPKPSEVFARFFGKKNGVDLPPRIRYRHVPVSFAAEPEE